MKKLIKVTQKHINEGKRYEEFSCPVALAIKEGAPYDAYVAAGQYGLKLGDTIYKSPRSVVRFVTRFDKKGKKAVKPFNFTLDFDSRSKRF